jgi:hypothetical protein
MVYGEGVVLVDVMLWELWAGRSKPSKFLHMQRIKMLKHTDNSYNESQQDALLLRFI